MLAVANSVAVHEQSRADGLFYMIQGMIVLGTQTQFILE
jgi:hypothetical protein